MKYICSLLLLTAFSGFAQVSHTVQSTGTASISVTPDQAQIQVSAVTTAVSAQSAANQNATLATNIQAALTQALGNAGTIQTVNYSINPNYNNQGTLTGYTVTNSIQVTLNNLALTGTIIDTATQAGATRIDSLTFSLKDNTSALTQALQAATLQAKAKADAMASSVGLKTGAFLVIQESGAILQPVTGSAPVAVSTPITAGQLSVTGNVTIQVQLQQ
jgi:uncharacterized protein YggE